jgi:hypothetical protein
MIQINAIRRCRAARHKERLAALRGRRRWSMDGGGRAYHEVVAVVELDGDVSDDRHSHAYAHMAL